LNPEHLEILYLWLHLQYPEHLVIPVHPERPEYPEHLGHLLCPAILDCLESHYQQNQEFLDILDFLVILKTQ
jgi:hypothetical protein